MTVADPESNAPPRPAGNVPLWLALVLLSLLVVATFWPVFGSGFSFWDDQDTIQRNHGFNPPTWESLLNRWTRPHLHIYVPLTHTVWHAVALISPAPSAGEEGFVIALPFKIASVAAHLMTSVAALLLLRRLISTGWVTLAAAMLFAVHPLQVESIAWTSGLKDVLFGMFGTLCLLVYCSARDNQGRPSSASVVAALVCLVLAGLSKPTAMVVPPLLLLLDVYHFRRRWGESIVRLVPFGLIGLVVGIFARIVQPPQEAATSSLGARPVIVIDSLSFYIEKLFWPARLAYDYGRSPPDVWRIYQDAFPWRLLIALTVIVAAAALVWVARRRARIVDVGIVIALLPLLPVLGFVTFDFASYTTVADHYVYLPMLGIAMAFAGWLDGRWRGAAVARVGVIALIGVLSFLSHRQATTWHDARSVALQTLSVNPRSFGSLGYLAVWELNQGRPDAARSFIQEAIAIRPNEPGTQASLAYIEARLGNVEPAIVAARKAAETSKFNAAYHLLLGELLGQNGQYEEALLEVEHAAKIDPSNRRAVELARQARAFLRSRAATRATTVPVTRPTTPPTAAENRK